MSCHGGDGVLPRVPNVPKSSQRSKYSSTYSPSMTSIPPVMLSSSHTVGHATGATLPQLPHQAGDPAREEQYSQVVSRLELLIAGETDLVAVMATIASELHNSFAYFNWTGFYRALPAVLPPGMWHVGGTADMLVIGLYQGMHGCLRIPFSRGVCGAAARTRTTQLVPDVHAFPGHIACASSTQSEIVVPIFGRGGCLLGVLDIDSNYPAAFTAADQRGLEAVAGLLGGFNREGMPAHDLEASA